MLDLLKSAQALKKKKPGRRHRQALHILHFSFSHSFEQAGPLTSTQPLPTPRASLAWPCTQPDLTTGAVNARITTPKVPWRAMYDTLRTLFK
jgi:hypothetical protein